MSEKEKEQSMNEPAVVPTESELSDDRNTKLTLRTLKRIFPATLKHKQRRYLAAYAITGGIVRATKKTGIDYRSHYTWMKQPEYAEAFEYAKQIAGDMSEDEVIRRGAEGIDAPIIYKGEITGQ